MTKRLIELTNVYSGYGGPPVLQDVSLHVLEGEAVAVLGANGAGKSTLLRTIMGQLPVSSGSCRIGDYESTLVSTSALARRGFLLVPGGRGVLSLMTVRENLLFGLDISGVADVKDEREERWNEVLDLFPVLGHRLGQSAGLLSGGERQMLTIGRALLARPRCLVLDEPSLGLAPRLVTETFSVLGQALERFSTTVLLVEQNVREALKMATRAYVLERGRVVIESPATQLANDPSLRDAYLGGSWTQGAGGTSSD
jgi:branched-chain amino acid transport system ATP-binding protein